MCVCVCVPRTVRLWQATSSNSLLSCCFLLLPPLLLRLHCRHLLLLPNYLRWYVYVRVCSVIFFSFLCSLPFVRHSCCCSSLVGCAYLNVLHSLLPGTRPSSAAQASPSVFLSLRRCVTHSSTLLGTHTHTHAHSVRYTHSHTLLHTNSIGLNNELTKKKWEKNENSNRVACEKQRVRRSDDGKERDIPR